MKKFLYILFVTFVFSACSEYQKAFKNDDIKVKYDLASKLYEEGIQENKKSKLKKAIQLFEQILPQYRGKPQGEKISYEYANAFYELGAYYDSSYQFERFAKAYPQSEKAEEAFFKSAKSDYHISPRYTLDQTETNKAIGKFQEYITLYPDGENIGEANQLSAELREKLELKEYEIAKLYHHREEYKPAIEAFNNFIEANPGSKYREKAYFYKMESAYLLAINSYAYLVPERLETAKVYYENYKKYFPSGELNEDANIIIQDINTRLENNNS